MGYHRAGFEVVGVDIKPQPNYPFAFVQTDALAFIKHADDFDAIHASPPCQFYSYTTDVLRDYDDLLEEVQAKLANQSKPFIIENVEAARPYMPADCTTLLCGSMFGMDVKRHRLFQTSFKVTPLKCDHKTGWSGKQYPTHAAKHKAQFSPVVQIYGTGGGAGKDIDLWRYTMRISWMKTRRELADAIPPVYTEYIGCQLMKK